MKLCDYRPLPDKTTASGKTLFRCDACGHESPAPTEKRCGRCSSCGNHFGTLGHVLNCQNLDEQETESLAKLRALLDETKVRR